MDNTDFNEIVAVAVEASESGFDSVRIHTGDIIEIGEMVQCIKAQNERLRERLLSNARLFDLIECDTVAHACCELANETPAQSLAAIKAEAVREFVGQFDYAHEYPEFCARHKGEEYAYKLEKGE